MRWHKMNTPSTTCISAYCVYHKHSMLYIAAWAGDIKASHGMAGQDHILEGIILLSAKQASLLET